MPKGRPTQGKWVTHKIPILGRRNCYIYKRPNSEVWQYYLQMDGEGQLRASTRIEGSKDDINVGQEEAIAFATEKYLSDKGRSQTGMKAIVKKKLFDLMDDFLKEEKKRIDHTMSMDILLKELFMLKSSSKSSKKILFW